MCMCIHVFQSLPECTVPQGLSLWPSPSRVHWPSLVLLSFITMGRVMASPRPPHSVWLRCQHQASLAIKQLAPFINLTSTIYGGEREGRKERCRERGAVGRKICGAGGELNERDKHQFPFHLLIVSSCLIQPQNGIMSALIKISCVYEDILNYPEWVLQQQAFISEKLKI